MWKWRGEECVYELGGCEDECVCVWGGGGEGMKKRRGENGNER